jgi:hypothetical protein
MAEIFSDGNVEKRPGIIGNTPSGFRVLSTKRHAAAAQRIFPFGTIGKG